MPWVSCDVGDSDAVAQATATLRAEIGPPDVLVLSAGISVSRPITDLSDEQWHRVMRVNLDGAFYMMRATMEHMIAQRWGRIVSVTSTTAVRAHPKRAVYAASKAGLIALTKVAATEGAPYGVTANIVAPGVTDTPLTRREIGDREALERTVLESPIANPMKVILEPIDIAAAIRFLTLPEARYITGDVLYVNAGGYMP